MVVKCGSLAEAGTSSRRDCRNENRLHSYSLYRGHLPSVSLIAVTVRGKEVPILLNLQIFLYILTSKNTAQLYQYNNNIIFDDRKKRTYFGDLNAGKNKNNINIQLQYLNFIYFFLLILESIIIHQFIIYFESQFKNT